MAAECPSPDDLQQRHGTVGYSNGPDGRRPGRHAYFGLRCGHSVLSGRVQGIQAEFSPRPMSRNLSTWAGIKLRTPGGHLGVASVPSAILGAAICRSLPGRRCDVRVRRSVTSGLPVRFRSLGTYSRTITEDCLTSLPPGSRVPQSANERSASSFPKRVHRQDV